MKLWLLLLSLLLVHVALAQQNCHPTCSWVCDDPQCDAWCEPVCEPPSCTVQCPENADPSHCRTPKCLVQCPDDGCELDSCPQCETVCGDIMCDCQVLCAPTACSWYCDTPTSCPRPSCELQCESPACIYVKPSSSTPATVSMPALLLLPMLLLLLPSKD